MVSPYLDRPTHPLADHLRARAELEYLMRLYGPIDVAKAARLGLEQRNQGEPS